MRRPTFLEGVAVAFAASLTGSVFYAVLDPVFGGKSLRLAVAGAGLGYLLYLLSRSGERTGRITAVALWSAAAVGLWLLSPPLPLYVLLHLAMIWLVRAFYFHAGVLPALADLGLTGFGLAAALWAAVHTGSLFLSLWCFFLIQALFVAIPTHFGTRGAPQGRPQVSDDRFQHAQRAAEAAVRTLSSMH